MSESTVSTDIAELSYEQARAELEQIVRQLETGTSTLEESIALWERGEALAQACTQILQGATTKITTAIAQRDAADTTVDNSEAELSQTDSTKTADN